MGFSIEERGQQLSDEEVKELKVGDSVWLRYWRDGKQEPLLDCVVDIRGEEEGKLIFGPIPTNDFFYPDDLGRGKEGYTLRLHRVEKSFQMTAETVSKLARFLDGALGCAHSEGCIDEETEVEAFEDGIEITVKESEEVTVVWTLRASMRKVVQR